MTNPAPKTLPDFLQLAYLHGVGVGGIRTDPAIAAAAAGFTRTELEARMAELAAVEQRCVVSKVQRSFLERVLALMPPG